MTIVYDECAENIQVRVNILIQQLLLKDNENNNLVII